jgi:prepilin-type processing-associated H-X9-DG protein
MLITTEGFSVSTGVWGDSSYVLNEAVLGIDDARGRARGLASKVRRSAETFLAADGKRTPTGDVNSPAGGWLLISNIATDTKPVTLADAFSNTGRADGPDAFDAIRHRGRINAVFVDGHVETVRVEAGDLARVFVLVR